MRYIYSNEVNPAEELRERITNGMDTLRLQVQQEGGVIALMRQT